jgi:hypothetical protein
MRDLPNLVKVIDLFKEEMKGRGVKVITEKEVHESMLALYMGFCERPKRSPTSMPLKPGEIDYGYPGDLAVVSFREEDQVNMFVPRTLYPRGRSGLISGAHLLSEIQSWADIHGRPLYITHEGSEGQDVLDKKSWELNRSPNVPLMLSGKITKVYEIFPGVYLENYREESK